MEDRKMAEEMVYEEAEVPEILTFTPEDDSSTERDYTTGGNSTSEVEERS
jgi:hypothetical protein